MSEAQDTVIALMQKDIEYIKEHQAQNKKDADAHFVALEKALDDKHREIMEAIREVADTKAGKWTERVLIWVGSVIGLALLGAWLSLILVK